MTKYPEDSDCFNVKNTSFFHKKGKEGNTCDYRLYISEDVKKSRIEVIESPVVITINFPLNVSVSKIFVDDEVEKITAEYSIQSELDVKQIIQSQLRQQLDVPVDLKSKYTHQTVPINLGFEK